MLPEPDPPKVIEPPACPLPGPPALADIDDAPPSALPPLVKLWETMMMDGPVRQVASAPLLWKRDRVNGPRTSVATSFHVLTAAVPLMTEALASCPRQVASAEDI